MLHIFLYLIYVTKNTLVRFSQTFKPDFMYCHVCLKNWNGKNSRFEMGYATCIIYMLLIIRTYLPIWWPLWHLSILNTEKSLIIFLLCCLGLNQLNIRGWRWDPTFSRLSTNNLREICLCIPGPLWPR